MLGAGDTGRQGCSYRANILTEGRQAKNNTHTDNQMATRTVKRSQQDNRTERVEGFPSRGNSKGKGLMEGMSLDI